MSNAIAAALPDPNPNPKVRARDPAAGSDPGRTTMKAAQLSVVALAAGALVVTGCGDNQEGTSRPAGKAATTVRLSATEFKFDPEVLKVKRPGTVTFVTKNDGQTVHALEIEGPSGEAETKEIQPGQSAKVTVKLDQAGTYTMYCPVGNHRQMGMAGKIAVLSGGRRGQTNPDQTETEEEPRSGSSGGY